MAISFLVSSHNDEEVTNSNVASLPTVNDGEFIIAQVTWNFALSRTLTPPSGWTALSGSAQSSGNLEQEIYYRVASSEPASYTWSWSGVCFNRVDYSTWSGVDSIDVTNGQGNSSSTSVAAPSVTTTVNDCQLLFFGSIRDDRTFTPPSGMSEQYDVQFGTGPNSGLITTTLADETLGSAGATGTRTATASGADVNIGQLVALVPVVVATGNPYHAYAQQ